MKHTMHFCPTCGAPVEHKIPAGDDRPRYVCSRDGEIFYHNPMAVVGCVAHWQSRVLLCRRAIAPRAGFWTLPAGFLELDETAAQGAARETMEEALAEVNVHGLFTFLDIPHIGQIHMFYRADMRSASYAAGPESLEVALFDEADIPWSQLAFPSVYHTLKHYFSDRRQGSYVLHSDALERGSWQAAHLDPEPDVPVPQIDHSSTPSA